MKEYVAQLARARGYELRGRGFESLLAQILLKKIVKKMGCSQAVRQLTLTQLFAGSIPAFPIFKNKKVNLQKSEKYIKIKE